MLQCCAVLRWWLLVRTSPNGNCAWVFCGVPPPPFFSRSCGKVESWKLLRTLLCSQVYMWVSRFRPRVVPFEVLVNKQQCLCWMTCNRTHSKRSDRDDPNTASCTWALWNRMVIWEVTRPCDLMLFRHMVLQHLTLSCLCLLSPYTQVNISIIWVFLLWKVVLAGKPFLSSRLCMQCTLCTTFVHIVCCTPHFITVMRQHYLLLSSAALPCFLFFFLPDNAMSNTMLAFPLDF